MVGGGSLIYRQEVCFKIDDAAKGICPAAAALTIDIPFLLIEISVFVQASYPHCSSKVLWMHGCAVEQ
jgi:hypothetical protein